VAAAGAPRARLVISTLRRIHDLEVLLDASPGVPVLVRVLEDPEETWIRSRGGQPVRFYDASVQQLMEWVEEEEPDLTARLRARVARPE
jgi:hypothetical protein